MSSNLTKASPAEVTPHIIEGTQARVTDGYVALQGKDFDLLEYWTVLLKHKWAILATMIVVTTLAGISALRATPMYTATGKIAINRENSDPLNLREGQASSTEDWDYAVMLDTQIRILQSESMALEVARSLNLDKNPKFVGEEAAKAASAENSSLQADPQRDNMLIGRMQSGLKVRALPGTRIVEITYKTPDPSLSASIVNAYINTYIEQNFKTKYDSTTQTSAWLQKQLQDLKLKVETAEEKLVRYQKDNGIVGIDEKQNITTVKLDLLNKELTDAEAQRIQREAAYRMAMAGENFAAPQASPLHKLREQQADLEAQLANLTTTFGPSYPKVAALRSQLDQVKKAVEGEHQREVARLKGEYLSSAERERMLRTKMQGQTQEANRLSERAIEYTTLKRDLESSRQLYDSLMQRMKEATVSAGLRSSNIRVVDIARVPRGPSEPNIPRTLAMALIASLCGGIGLAFILEHVDKSIRTPEEVQFGAGLPPLAMIPLESELAGNVVTRRLLPSRTEKVRPGVEDGMNLVTLRKPKSEIAEAYRALRTSILLSGLGEQPKLILVTSPLPREGKTTTGVNTAIVLSQSGSRVLLIDADMRKPSVHQRFDIRSPHGLSTVLSGGSTLDQSILQVAQVPNLSVLLAGPIPPHPAELLGSQKMRDLLEQCREQFDYVVVDTPPVLSVTDAVVLSIYADAVLIVIRSGQTSKQALRRTRDVLSNVSARIAGVVVNAFDLQSPDNRYYYSAYGYKDGSSYYHHDAAAGSD